MVDAFVDSIEWLMALWAQSNGRWLHALVVISIALAVALGYRIAHLSGALTCKSRAKYVQAFV